VPHRLRVFAVIVLAASAATLSAQTKPAAPAAEKPASTWSAATWSGLKFRSIGPALTSGRIADIAVDPTKPSRWFVASASGGVWKTENAGTSWTPVFDHEGSYSIGCVTIDPNNPFTVWVGTGENNNQRALGYGDGVYKSLDGGRSWTRMGLENSQHIAKIIVDPKDSNTVYVAAIGPVWSGGGDRGVYKTTDGGKTWKAVLTISENTGVTDLVMDPRDPNVLIAAAFQRRRHVWTYIGGGPESAVYKTTDGGASWRKVMTGLPSGDLGRIGLAISPKDPDVVYAMVETADDSGGVFRSTDRGETWQKRGGYFSSGNYYVEIYADPANVDRVYSMDTFLQVSNDGGKTWHNLGEDWKHVDNHVIWVDPANTDHMLTGCDGGVYETFDAAKSWNFKANLPVAQFYRVTVDDSSPVYNVYGGMQDNSSVGGPSRTLGENGITNQDWFFTFGGDGFTSKVEPGNPDIVYALLQYGTIARFDRKTGQDLGIQPQAGPGQPPLRWNWDAPLLISPFSPTRLYFAANILFRSDDRGSTWKAVSPDLTRQLDRNTLKVMGRVWPPDAVAKDQSTSIFGNIVSLDESPLAEGLLYVGTDDGLVQVSEDGGTTWRKDEKFPGVPDMTYVSDLTASPHDANTVYAAFNNHKMGDFKPYLLKSTDRGRTWTSIAGNLPERGSVWTVAEDPDDAGLLFAGTEFGLFFTKDGGKDWIQLKGGLPTIAVRDMAFQRREHDLVIATFGRGIYILDDYTPLEAAKPADLDRAFTDFTVRRTLGYIPSIPLGMKGKAFFGESFFMAPNPPYGAVFTYYLKDGLKTKKELRHEAEEAAIKKGETIKYPTDAEFEAEAREPAPEVLITVKDAAGNVVRKMTGPVGKGFHRVAWNLRFAPSTPISIRPEPTDDPFYDPPTGPMVVPGKYTVSFETEVDGKTAAVGQPETFEVINALQGTLGPTDRAALLAFQEKTANLQRAVMGASSVAHEALDHLAYVKKALMNTPKADPKLADQALILENRLKDVLKAIDGDRVKARRSEPTPTSISGRVFQIVGDQWMSTSPATDTSQRDYDAAADQFGPVLETLRRLIDVDMKQLDSQLDLAGAPWTPGRVPVWKK
jgi:photosystem II stability/assembly factor-like uncharacterized protein